MSDLMRERVSTTWIWGRTQNAHQAISPDHHFEQCLQHGASARSSTCRSLSSRSSSSHNDSLRNASLARGDLTAHNLIRRNLAQYNLAQHSLAQRSFGERSLDDPAQSHDLQLACGSFVLLLLAALADLIFRI